MCVCTCICVFVHFVGKTELRENREWRVVERKRWRERDEEVIIEKLGLTSVIKTKKYVL